ncbi:hypothetical protein Tdes44962_MAKER01190 [Teratosphaeria destructans]|uniref:Uncharacterized protein n=1 Tax=Teratosphaeria destructans TaxID=418781 RepID=A0A9W7T1V5_9PEZI|nr:hypothetical protein Tdes44962_MAKER01190 [Teratosphaeria destructans]
MGSPPRTLGILSDEPKPRRGWDRESGDAATSINDTASSKQRVRQELERERQHTVETSSMMSYSRSPTINESGSFSLMAAAVCLSRMSLKADATSSHRRAADTLPHRQILDHASRRSFIITSLKPLEVGWSTRSNGFRRCSECSPGRRRLTPNDIIGNLAVKCFDSSIYRVPGWSTLWLSWGCRRCTRQVREHGSVQWDGAGAKRVQPARQDGFADQVVKPPNMNYANMIEEKHLKKGFIIATLVSTLVGTITASMTLKDKVQEQRNKNKQQALDKTQDAKIKELTEKIGKLEQAESADKDKKDKDDTKSQRSSRSSSRRRRRRRDDEDDEDDYEDDFNYNARRSRAMIERMYEDHLRRVGLDYAQGDVITENKLQAQIIQLQQTVINVLQDALYSGRSLTQGDMQRLIEAQHAARENSLDALQGQFARMQAQKKTLQPVKKAYLLNDDPPPPPKQLTFPVRNGSTRSHSPPSPRKVKTLPVAPPPRLFCRYSETIQTTKQFLSRAFTPSGDGRCPGCRVSLPVDTRDVWVFSTQIPSSTPGGPVKKKEFQMDARFVVKCHTEDGRFACVVCHRLRDKDCICRDVDALIKHLATFHTPGEFEKDDDLISMKSGSQVSGRALVLAT